MDIGVLFADVRGSTELGERLGASAFAALLNRFYQVAENVLIAHDGLIDKLVGDEVVALFIPGICGAEYRRRSVQAGVALAQALRAEGELWLAVGVGVHAGPAFVGNVGSSGIVDFTALGDTVNTTARLQSAGAAGEVVLSETAYAAAAEDYPNAEPRVVQLRGKADPFAVRVLRPGIPEASHSG